MRIRSGIFALVLSVLVGCGAVTTQAAPSPNPTISVVVRNYNFYARQINLFCEESRPHFEAIYLEGIGTRSKRVELPAITCERFRVGVRLTGSRRVHIFNRYLPVREGVRVRVLLEDPLSLTSITLQLPAPEAT